MIRISQQDSAGAAKKYYSTADYYNEGQELVGSWGGKLVFPIPEFEIVSVG